MGNPLYFAQTNFIVVFAATMFPIHCTTAGNWPPQAGIRRPCDQTAHYKN